MNTSTARLVRTPSDITVLAPTGEIGFVLGQPGDYEAWANLEPLNGFGRAAVQGFKSLRDAVRFIQQEGVA